MYSSFRSFRKRRIFTFVSIMVCVSWYSFIDGLPGRIWSQRVMVRCVCSPISLRRPWSFRKRMAVTGNDLGTFNSVKDSKRTRWERLIWKMVAGAFFSKILASIDLWQYIILEFITIPHSSISPGLLRVSADQPRLRLRLHWLCSREASGSRGKSATGDLRHWQWPGHWAVHVSMLGVKGGSWELRNFTCKNLE